VGELEFLRRWKDEILTKIKNDSGQSGDSTQSSTETALAPIAPDRIAELRAKIESAVFEERYEDAAMLRDELKRLEG
jgi:protein-arginine kinase activator protein McsA